MRHAGGRICDAAQTDQEAVLRLFDLNEAWLSGVLEDGRQHRTFDFAGPAIEAARVLVTGLEGAMLLARSYGDAERFDRAARRLLAEPEGATSASAPRARSRLARAGSTER